MKHHAAKECDYTKCNSTTGELMAPCHPDARKPEKGYEVEVELADQLMSAMLARKIGSKFQP